MNGTLIYRFTLFFLGLCFFCPSIKAQETFARTYLLNQESGNSIKSFAITENGGVVAVLGSVIEVPTTRAESTIVEIDPFGELVWSARLGNDSLRYLTSFRNGTIIHNDTIFSTFHINGIELDVQGNGLLRIDLAEQEFTVVPSSVSDSLLRSRDLAYYDDFRKIVDVRTRINNLQGTSLAGTVIRRDRYGTIVSSANILDEYLRVGIQGTSFDEEGNLFVSYEGCLDDGTPSCDFNQGWLRKYSPNDEVVWTKNFGSTSGAQPVAPRVARLTNGNLAYGWTRDTFNLSLQRSPPIVYFLSPEGEELDSIVFHGNIRSLIDLTPAANGDVIGAGTAVTDIGETGWMFRVTQQGDLVWERYILDERNSNRVSCDFTNVEESEDGSIFASGAWFSPGLPFDNMHRLRGWLVKLDADGCLEPGCTSDTIHLQEPVSLEGPLVNTQELTLQVVPNPITSEMTLSLGGFLGNAEQLRYAILSTVGQPLLEGRMSSSTHRTNLQGLPPGVYVLIIYESGVPVATQRIVKI